ncbi:hypothetical protein WJ968_33860 [Achromobacter xylosoxidans]
MSDVDAGSGLLTVTLSVPSGTLSAISGNGVTVGGSAGALTLTGSQADLNAFIAAGGLRYLPGANIAGGHAERQRQRQWQHRLRRRPDRQRQHHARHRGGQ